MTCAICNVEVSDQRGQPMCLTCRRIELEGLRDQFAMAALTGLCSVGASTSEPDIVDRASSAYRIADAMIKAREVVP